MSGVLWYYSNMKKMEKDSNQAATLAKQADQVLNATEEQSTSAIKDSDALVTDAKKPIPDFNAEEMKSMFKIRGYYYCHCRI